MPKTLKNDGVEFYRKGKTELKSFMIFGERSTGTNLLMDVVRKNLRLQYYPSGEWKHGWPNAFAIPKNHLIFVMLRDAESWSLSMFAKPWEAQPAIFKLGFSEFLRHPWKSAVYPSQPLNWDIQPHRHEDFDMQQILLDLHPIEGRPFHNIYEMRNIKTKAWLGLKNYATNVVYIRLDFLQNHPEELVTLISSAYQTPISRVFEKSEDYHGENRFWQERKNERPKTLSAEDRAFMLDNLDLEQEAYLGYDYETHKQPRLASKELYSERDAGDDNQGADDFGAAANSGARTQLSAKKLRDTHQ